MKDLLPCPFCGGEVNITYYSADNVFVVWHKDDKCKFIEPMYIDGKYAKSLSDARNIWNKRENELLKEQEEREQRICKEICDFIRGACSTDTDDDKDFVCYEIQKCFMKGR